MLIICDNGLWAGNFLFCASQGAEKKSPFSQSNSDSCQLTTRTVIPKLENIFPNSKETTPFLQYLENALVVNGNYFFLTLGR